MIKTIFPASIPFLCLAIMFFVTYIRFWAKQSPQSERNGFQRFSRRVYLHFVGYSDEEFYAKFSCQRRVLFPYKTEDDFSRSPYSSGIYQSPRKKEYIENLFDNRLSTTQREILLEDVFGWSLTYCRFGGKHENAFWRTYMASDVSSDLVKTHLEDLTSKNATLLLSWLISTYPMALADDIKGISDEKKQMQILLRDHRLPRETVWSSFITLIEHYHARIEALTVSGSLYPKDKDGNSLLNHNYDFLLAFILDSRRTKEEITLLAYKPYLWLIPSLSESPLMGEEERVISSLMANGATQ